MTDNNSNLSNQTSELSTYTASSASASMQTLDTGVVTVQQISTELTSTPAANSVAKVDFLSSAMRHLRDGDYLKSNGYVENAGQLYGFVAECGLKALFVLHGGYPVDVLGNPQRAKPSLRKHIDGILPLLDSLDLFCSGRTSNYLSMLPNISCFLDWSVDHRYCSAESIPQSLEQWREGAYEVAVMLEQAKLDGVLI